MRRHGYTLIELLIVITIVGIGASAVILSVRGNETRRLGEDADRLGALFRMAQGEARVSGRALLWEADLGGYSFRWVEPSTEILLPEELNRRRTWSVDVRRIDNTRLLFSREPLREPAVVEITTAGDAMRLELDALGEPRRCTGTQCAASR